MGTSVSKLEKALADVPESERYYGFENHSSTCYCNSVLQALLFCVPFREQVIDYCAEIKNSADAEDNLLTCLADLFTQISSQKRKTGTMCPKRFIDRVKKDNEVFRTYMHQDAHEFLNFLLNGLAEILEKGVNGADSSSENFSDVEKIENGPSSSPDNGIEKDQPATFIHKIFQGVLTNETRCLRCETVTARDEMFLDLSIDIQENSSITSCLKKFSSIETLNAEDKFFCDECSSLQEAQRSMKIKKAPQILVIHLKRFKYFDNLGRHSKLFYRVAYPLELKINSTMDDPDTEYHLFAVVVHMGRGANQGHYISLIKSYNHWLSFDDETVDESSESAVQSYFGTPEKTMDKADHGYILFYERVEKRSE